MIEFTILIPTWNNLQHLQLVVESIRKNSAVSNQIIIFVNEGNDGSLEWVKEQTDLDYRHVEENVGICYALNQCRDLIKGNYLVYMNDDMYVCPGWDTSLMNVIREIGHDNFMLSATAVEPRAVSNPSYVNIVRDFGDSVSSFREKDLIAALPDLKRSDWSGASWPPSVISVRLWDMVGGYSIEFTPGMYSDPDFSMKLWTYGVRIFRGVGSSLIYNFQSKSTGRSKLKRNDGATTFLLKWGMTSKTFYKYYLRMGEPVTILKEIQLPVWEQLRNKLKRMLKAYRA